MNIFYLDTDVDKCAEYHCDKHCVKMITEYCQLLCSAINMTGGTAPYKTTHKNHPCSKWVRLSSTNWEYLKLLGIKLHDQYKIRYGKTHKAGLVIQTLNCPKLDSDDWTDPPQCMPDIYKDVDTVQAYRNFYVYDKIKFAKWKNGDPDWFAPYRQIV